LVAVGIPAVLAQGSIVFTLNSSNTSEEIDYVLEKLPVVVDRLRSLSPIWQRETPFVEQEAAG
jgi:cysteine desulfurase